MSSPENIDLYFQDRLERAKQHRVLTRIEKEALPQEKVESNKELPNPTIDGLIEDLGWSQKAVDNLIDAATKGLIKITRVGDDEVCIELLPIVVLPTELGHVTEMITLQNNIKGKQPVFGSAAQDVFTYLQTTDFAVEGYMDDETHGKKYARVYLNSTALQETRNVYLDPESLAETDYEYGHAFCVYGGVPFSAISRVDIIQAKEKPFKLSGSDWPDYKEGEVEREMARQAARLREFVDWSSS